MPQQLHRLPGVGDRQRPAALVPGPHHVDRLVHMTDQQP
jgi:hypothetical protein